MVGCPPPVQPVIVPKVHCHERAVVFQVSFFGRILLSTLKLLPSCCRHLSGTKTNILHEYSRFFTTLPTQSPIKMPFSVKKNKNKSQSNTERTNHFVFLSNSVK